MTTPRTKAISQVAAASLCALSFGDSLKTQWISYLRLSFWGSWFYSFYFWTRSSG